jgi:hypothetical protein
VSFAYELSPSGQSRSSKIKILDTKVLEFKDLNGIKFEGISDLAYDEERGLYALSDFGRLFKLKLEIKHDKIESVSLQEAYVLKTKKGKKLTKKKSDAEGMVFSDEGLIVSFERHPKVSLFNLQGQKLKNFAINEDLIEIKNYQKKNKALEAVTLHPDFGIITSPEIPLKNEDDNYHKLYALNKTWTFKADYKITSMITLKDKNLLVLERNFSYLRGYDVVLKKVDLNNCKKICESSVLAHLQSSQGWNLDNFEGLTQVGENLYLMVSDDNGSFLQKTLLVLFSIRQDKE